MRQKQKRASAYYLARIESEFPSIHADYLAGKYATVRAAAIAAGLRKEATPLSSLKATWQKASPSERAQFLSFIGTTPSAPNVAPIAVDGRLVPAAVAKIQATASHRGLSMGDIMREIGFNPLDASLGMAIRRATRLRPAMIAALETWLARQP